MSGDQIGALPAMAERVGLRQQGRSSWSPCPVCGATRRGREERRGPISFFAGNSAWRCHAGGCDARGDAMSLYAAHRLGRIPGREEREVWGSLFTELGEGTLRAGSELRRPAARRQAQEARQRPQEPQGGAEPPGAGAALLRALWAVCGPLAGAATDDSALACLQARGLHPEGLDGQGLVRLLPATWSWPAWLSAPIRERYRLVAPVFDERGALASVRFRADTRQDRQKSRPPAGMSCRGLVLAEPLAQALLRGERGADGVEWDGRVVIAEGEPDLWTWATCSARQEQILREQRTFAVFGVVSGAWTPGIAARIPDGATVLIRTHQDAAGDGYADEIRKTLEGRCQIRRPERAHYEEMKNIMQNGAIPDENDLLILARLPVDPAEGTAPMHDPEAQAQQELIARLPWVRPTGAWLDAKPLPRPYLLHLPPGAGAFSMRGDGMVPKGKVGILAAAGGVGKTFALCGLALSVVTGRPWLGRFPTGAELRQRVVLVLGEEDEPELRRRLHQQATAMALLPPDEPGQRREEERERAREAVGRILTLPGSGLDSLALTRAEEGGQSARTPFADALYRFLEEEGRRTGGWDAIILDPLSRFAGPDVETDNAAATRLIQVLERFTKLPGGPAVLLAHHTNKASRSADAGAASAASVRGSSALVDGARWVASLEEVVLPGGGRYPGAARFRVTKSNYGRVPEEEVLLIRTGEGGIRAATPEEQLQLDRIVAEGRAPAARKPLRLPDVPASRRSDDA